MNSKKKGDRAELEASKLLIKVTGEEWHRVPMSGATATSKDVENYVFKGDLFCEAHPYNKVCVEVKVTPELHLSDLWRKKKVKKYFEQAKSQAEEKEWVLMVKVNRRGWFIFFPAYLGEYNKALWQDINLGKEHLLIFNEYKGYYLDKGEEL